MSCDNVFYGEYYNVKGHKNSFLIRFDNNITRNTDFIFDKKQRSNALRLNSCAFSLIRPEQQQYQILQL